MRRSSAGSPTLSAAAGVTRPEGGAGGVKMTKKVKARQDQKKKKKKSLGPYTLWDVKSITGFSTFLGSYT